MLSPLPVDMDLPTNEPAGAGESTQAENQKEGTSEAKGRQCARSWYCHPDGPRGHREVAAASLPHFRRGGFWAGP